MPPNVTDYDITVGPNGVLRPDLWFDAKLGGLANQAFPGVAYDRIARIVVLPAHQGFGQLVRLDQGALGQTLAGNPSASMQVLASVVTNPMAVSEGVGPGPAGHRQAFKPLSRAGFPLSQPGQRKRVLAALESGPPAEKLRSLEMLAAYVQLIGSAKQMDEPMRAIGTEFASAMTQSRSDTVPVVAAYATYLTARLSSPDVRGELIERLAISENWPARLLGLIATAGMPVEKQLAYADKLGRNDLEPALKAFAAATADYLRSPAAIQPTTQPTTQPVSQTAPAVGAAAPNAAPAAPGVSVPSRSTSGAGGPGKRGG